MWDANPIFRHGKPFFAANNRPCFCLSDPQFSGQDPVVSQISRLEWLNWDWTEQHWKSPWHLDTPGLLPRDIGMHTSASGKDLRPKSGCQTGDIQYMFQPWFGEWKLRQVILLATSQPTGKYGASEHKGFPSPKRACPIKIKNCYALLIFFCLNKKEFFRKCPRDPGNPCRHAGPTTEQHIPRYATKIGSLRPA